MFWVLHDMGQVSEEKFGVFQVNAHNLLGVVNCGSPRLMLNELARELFWFCLGRRINIMIE